MKYRQRRLFIAPLLLCAAALGACRGQAGGSEAELLASARAYLQKQDFPAANIQLKNALQKNPESREARLLLGRSLLDGGESGPAAIELRKALELGADASQVQPLLAKALLAQGEVRQVVKQFADLTLPDPAAEAEVKTVLATALLAQGEKEAAQAAVLAALQAQPGHVPATLLQARLRAAEADVPGALALLEQVLVSDPKHLGALLLKGDLQRFGQRDPAAAMVTYQQAIDAHPKAVLAHTGGIGAALDRRDLADARQRLGQLKAVQPAHPETLLLEGQFAFEDKDYKRTRELTEPLLRQMPEDIRVLRLAGMNELQLNSLVQAEAHLVKLVKAAPQAPLPRQMLATVYNRNGEPGKALAILKPILDAANPDSTSLTLAGEALLQTGDSAAAEAAFTRAARSDPGATTARSALALAQIARGNTSAGMAELESAAASDTGIRSNMALIAARVRANDIAGALKAIDALEKKQPERPVPHVLRGSVLLRKGDTTAAAASFEQALKIDPRYFPATAGLASIELAAGKPENAKKRFDDLLALDPRNARALLGLAELKARTGGSKEEVTAAMNAAVKANPTEPGLRVLLINHLLGQKDAAAALSAAQDASSALPNSVEVLDALGSAQMAGDQAQQAISTFGKLASLRPDRPEAELRLAEAHLAVGDLKSAKRSLKKALEIRPGLFAAQRGLVQLALREYDPNEALRIAREVQRDQPKAAAGFALEAQVELSRNKPDAAVPLLKKVLELADSAENAIRLHVALQSAQKGPEASRHAAAWIQRHPRDTAFLFYLGDEAMSRRDFAQAEAQYRKVIELQPNNALALNNLAWLMGQAKRPGALTLAQKANELLPDQPAMMDTLAYLLALENQPLRAVELQKRAIAKAPLDQGLRLTLAKIYLQSGDKVQARTELEMLAKLGDKFSAQAEVKQLLATL